MSEVAAQPEGFLASRHVALPRDTNTHGDIFGGWLMSQMDLAGGVSAGRIAMGRVVTIAVKEMLFMKPVKVGNLISCYTNVSKVGQTSITIKVEAWAQSNISPDDAIKVTEGTFTYVAVTQGGTPRAIKITKETPLHQVRGD